MNNRYYEYCYRKKFVQQKLQGSSNLLGGCMKTREAYIKRNSEIFFITPSNLAKNTFFYVTCSGHFYYEPNYRLSRDTYNSYLIMYIKKGKARITYQQKQYFAKEGDIVYLNCYYPHAYEAVDNLETIWFHYDGISASAYDRALLENTNGIFTLEDSKCCVHYIEKIYESCREASENKEALINSYITTVLSELFRQGSYENAINRNSIAKLTMKYIEEHLTADLSIKTLAKQVSLSEYYFARTFKKESGYSPHEYIVKTRVTKAKVMLKSSEHPQKEIARLCGFHNESSFVTSFKKNTGMTPGVFRDTIV